MLHNRFFVTALGTCLILFATSTLAQAREKPKASPTPDPFAIDLTPDDSAIQTNTQPAPSPPATANPVSTVVQNMNPDISVVGDFAAGNPAALQLLGDPISPPIKLREVEVDAAGYVSPYAKAFFVTSFGSDGADVEEGYMDFFHLPGSLDIKLGKMLADLDTLNPQHQHAYPFVDRPLALQHTYGDEGLKAVGMNASILIPNPWDHYLLLSSTLADNPDEDQQYTFLYGGNAHSILYTAKLTSSWDLSDVSYITANATGLFAPLPDDSTTRTYEADMLFRYAPDPANYAMTLLTGIVRGQGNPTQIAEHTDWGYYVYGGWLFSSNWKIGARYDQTQFRAFGGQERQVSGILTFYPTETNYVRLQYARHQYPATASAAGYWGNQIWLQVDFVIGPHQQHAAL